MDDPILAPEYTGTVDTRGKSAWKAGDILDHWNERVLRGENPLKPGETITTNPESTTTNPESTTFSEPHRHPQQVEELQAEVERLRRDHEAMEILRRKPYDATVRIMAWAAVGPKRGDPADAILTLQENA